MTCEDLADRPYRNILLDSGTLKLPSTKPGGTTRTPLPASVSRAKLNGEAILTVMLRTCSSTSWVDTQHEVAWHQHRVTPGSPPPAAPNSPRALPKTRLRADRSGATTIVSSYDFSFAFDTARGYLTSWVAGGVPLLEQDAVTGAAMVPGFWRPPTDNDVPISLPYWRRFGVDALTSQLRSFSLNELDNGAIQVTTQTYLSPPVLAWGFQVLTTYTISTNGSLSVDVSLTPTGPAPEHVPRAGLDLRLSNRLTQVRYLGLGPGESYPDKRLAQRMGIWAVESVSSLHTRYDVPQENGNRMGTQWVRLLDSRGAAGLRCSAGDELSWSEGANLRKDGFSFVAKRYSDEMLEKAKHPCDLVEDEAVFLRLDAKVAGVGTAACGPGVREDLLVKAGAMKFGFLLERA